MLAVTFGLVLALVACLASVAVRSAQATVQCTVTEFTRQAEAQRKLMEAQDEFTLGAIVKMHEKLWSQVTSKDLMEFVRSNGLLPFLQDRQSMVNMEIEVIMKNLGCDRAEAIGYIRSRFAHALAEAQPST